MMEKRDPQKQLWNYQVNLDKRVRSESMTIPGKLINLESDLRLGLSACHVGCGHGTSNRQLSVRKKL
jgi:hypothetical protein